MKTPIFILRFFPAFKNYSNLIKKNNLYANSYSSFPFTLIIFSILPMIYEYSTSVGVFPGLTVMF